MEIKYITNVRIPTPRAQGYAIMKMCSEFAKLGVKINLFVPSRESGESEKDPFDFYKIERNFEIKKIPSFDFLMKTLKFGRLFYWLDILSFFIGLFLKKVVKSKGIIYTRDFMVPLLFFKNKFVCLELHDLPQQNFIFKWAIKIPKLFFVLNENIKNELIKTGVDKNKINIAPSGVAVNDFNIMISKEEARKDLALPAGKIVVYSGQLYSWKGADTLAEAAKFIPEANFVFVGGIEPELSEFIKKYGKFKNILILPFQQRSVIPKYLKAADVLVLPNSGKEKVSVKYTSPLKLFEYMSSGRPIVASDLPSIRVIMEEEECFFAQPDDPGSFASVIKKVFNDEEGAQKRAERAFQKVGQYNWDKRAQKILEIIKDDLVF